MDEVPPLDDGLKLLRRFVAEQEFSTELVWVFREDVTNCRRTYWIRVPVPEVNFLLARRHYDFGRAQRLGVRLEILCRLEGRSACYVWVARDREDASYAMQPSGLRLSVPCDPIDAIPVGSSLIWEWQRRANTRRRCETSAASVPSRSEINRFDSGTSL